MGFGVFGTSCLGLAGGHLHCERNLIACGQMLCPASCREPQLISQRDAG